MGNCMFAFVKCVMIELSLNFIKVCMIEFFLISVLIFKDALKS